MKMGSKVKIQGISKGPLALPQIFVEDPISLLETPKYGGVQQKIWGSPMKLWGSPIGLQ